MTALIDLFLFFFFRLFNASAFVWVTMNGWTGTPCATTMIAYERDFRFKVQCTQRASGFQGSFSAIIKRKLHLCLEQGFLC